MEIINLLVRKKGVPNQVPYPPANVIDVYVVAGQSNTDGRVATPSCPVADGTGLVIGLQMFNITGNKTFTNWKFGTNSGADNNVSTSWAFDVIALKQMRDYIDRPIYVIKHTQGGTSMTPTAVNNGNWAIPFDQSISPSMSIGLKEKIDFSFNRLTTLGLVPNFKGILWHQGESDSQTPNTYKSLMLTWIPTLRGWCRNSNLPFFFGTVAEASSQYNAIVNTGQREISVEIPHCYLVDNSLQSLQGDILHFDGPGSVDFGNQVFDFMKQVIGKN